jgi:hypothetical protein
MPQGFTASLRLCVVTEDVKTAFILQVKRFINFYKGTRLIASETLEEPEKSTGSYGNSHADFGSSE